MPASRLQLPVSPIPHVFIFPPEEEQHGNPPWCCFNASDHDEPLDHCDDSSLDAQYIDVALDFIRDSENISDSTPVYRRASLDESPRKCAKRSSSALSFISYRNDGEGRHHSSMELPEGINIVEVVKVRRNEGKTDPSSIQHIPATMKRSKTTTIKLPFQMAFRSIKNVGKSRKAPRAKEVRTSSSSVPSKAVSMPQEDILPHPLTRRASRRLSQLFSRSRVDLASVTPSEPSPAEARPSSPVMDRPPSLAISTAQSSSLPYLRNTDTSPSIDDLGFPTFPDVNSPEPTSERSVSPSLSRSSQRFSVMDLHHLFTFSAPVGEDHASTSSSRSPSQDPGPSLPPLVISNDATSTSSSSVSSYNYFTFSALDTDCTSTVDTTVNFTTNTTDIVAGSSGKPQTPAPSSQPASVPGDINVEMRLNSLHFDSLSFDPEDFQFDVSLSVDARRDGGRGY